MKFKTMLSLLPCIFAAAVAAGPIHADEAKDAPLHEEIEVLPGRTITPDEAVALSNAAARVLRHIAQARGAIHDQDLDQARRELDQARKLIAIIKAARPTVRLRDHIWTADRHLDYEDTEEVGEDLIPIEAQLTELEGLIPTQEIHRHIAQAHRQLQAGNKAAAHKALKAAEEAVVLSEADLPLSVAEREVIAAQGFLDKHQLAQADQALKAAEDSVVVTSIGAETPLGQAHAGFWEASKAYAARQYTAARENLDKANHWLKDALESSDQAIRAQAVKLKRAMDELQDKLKEKTR